MRSEAPQRAVANLEAESLAKLQAARAEAQSKVIAIDARISAFCVRYSRAHGYPVNLTVEQVQRHIDYGTGRG